MDETIDRIIGGAEFRAAHRVMRVVRRVPFGLSPDEDVLLLANADGDGSATDCTSVAALFLEVETGRWTITAFEGAHQPLMRAAA